MDKLLEALQKTSLTKQQVEEVSKAVEEMVSEAVKQVEAKKETEFETKVEEAYENMQAEIDAVEAKALEGYQQAYGYIQEQKLRTETLEREYENKMEEGYQQAWDLLEEEKAKNETLELNVMKEADENLKNMRDFMVEKLDLFLQLQKAEIYDEARCDVLNDPKMVEHRVAVEKMAEIMSDYLSVEEVAGISSKKISEAQNYIEDLEGRVKILEKKNINQTRQIHDLNESARQGEQLITEAKAIVTKKDKKERKNSSGNVSGRGQRVLQETKENLIPEFVDTNKKSEEKNLNESEQALEDMLVLSGLVDNN